jgi:hypothetical protein
MYMMIEMLIPFISLVLKLNPVSLKSIVRESTLEALLFCALYTYIFEAHTFYILQQVQDPEKL